MQDTVSAFASIDYLESVLKYCTNCGMSADEVLAGTTLSALAAENNQAFISVDDAEILLANITHRLQLPPYQLGLFIGLGFSASSHGQIGFVGLCSDNFDQALRLTTRFIGLVTPAFSMDYELTDDLAFIRIAPRGPIPEASYAFFLGLLLGGLRAMSLTLLGERLFQYVDRSVIELKLAESMIDERWRSATGPIKFRYGAAENRVIFARELVEVALPSANRASLLSAVSSCEAKLTALEAERKLQANPATGRVLEFLQNAKRPYPVLKDAAEYFCVSDRTLHRQLQREGASFGRLVNEYKMNKAKQLLLMPDISIKEVAYELDYSDVSNFSVAFKRATGLSPSQFRG